MDYILSIDSVDEVADIMETLDTLDDEGATYLISGGEDTRNLGDGLWEIKKSKHRIYYVYCVGNRVFLLHACYKQKGSAEKVDLEIGRKRMKEVLKRERSRRP